ncbi:hypothetical protein KC909_06075 [Candidatus Dojkabacteria bacterium]|uniref:Uncharacterized protein n=1 Tax=Candidatus Dojkabacteria bacterium TaxID=2099670 RepID=A0A955L6G1_9BACT|nr:hypothetical protein [Candidatus Dojkabacteria bacterium]
MTKKVKAFGLVEALLALAIFGTAIIAATAVTIKSLRTVKNNELADFANSVMVRSMEYTRSESGTNAVLSALGPEPWLFSLQGDVTDPNSTIFLADQAADPDPNRQLDIDECTSTSRYLIDMSGDPELAGLLFCNQIIVETLGDNYQVTSRMVFQTGNEFQFAEITGFKVQ